MNEGKEAAEKRYPDPGEPIMPYHERRIGYADCFTELLLPERERAEAQGKMIEKLTGAIFKIKKAGTNAGIMQGWRELEDVLNEAALSSIPASTTKEQEL